MKSLGLLCCLFIYVHARPTFEVFKPNEYLTEYHNKITENGYDFGFRTGFDTKRSEAGQLIPNNEESILNVKGDYSYRSPDGTQVSVDYSSGANGYRAKFVIEKIIQIISAAPAPKPISTAAIASLAGGGLG